MRGEARPGSRTAARAVLRATLLGVLTLGPVAACGADPAPEAEPAADATGGPSDGGSPADDGDATADGPPLSAEVRQSSRDAAAGQVQVMVTNATAEDLEPTRIVYRDPRLPAPVPAERMRTVPDGTTLGFPVPLIAPACPVPARASAELVVVAGGQRRVVPVTDPNGTLAGHARQGCDARRVARVARLSFAEEVPTGSGRRATARLLLRAEPTGRLPGAALVVEAVGGTPVLKPARGLGVWRPGLRVTGAGDAREVALPVVPARCDSHAFLEAGGATAFRADLRLTEPGRPPLRTSLVLRMPPEGARAVIDHALEACGLTG